MLARVIQPVINWTKGPATLILATILTSIGLNTLAADPYVSIVLISRMFRGEYIKERLKPVTLSTSIADQTELDHQALEMAVNKGQIVVETGI